MSSVVNAADIIGGTIIKIEAKPGPDESDDEPDECRSVTFYTITTEKGRCDVILHVDHNGYYGGQLSDPKLVDSIPKDAQ